MMSSGKRWQSLNLESDRKMALGNLFTPFVALETFGMTFRIPKWTDICFEHEI